MVFVPFLFIGSGFDSELLGRVLAGYALLIASSVLYGVAFTWNGGKRTMYGPALAAFVPVVAGAFWLDERFGVIALSGAILGLFNAFSGRAVVVIDVLSISALLVLAALGGVVLIDGYASPWGLICLFLASCVVALGQRRNEMVRLGAGAREVLKEYTPKLLDQMLAVVTSSTLVAYTLYAISAFSSTASLGMLYSLVLVNFGLFRYLFLVYRGDMSCGAELALFRDLQLMATVLLWLACMTVIHDV